MVALAKHCCHAVVYSAASPQKPEASNELDVAGCVMVLYCLESEFCASLRVKLEFGTGGCGKDSSRKTMGTHAVTSPPNITG